MQTLSPNTPRSGGWGGLAWLQGLTYTGSAEVHLISQRRLPPRLISLLSSVWSEGTGHVKTCPCGRPPSCLNESEWTICDHRSQSGSTMKRRENREWRIENRAQWPRFRFTFAGNGSGLIVEVFLEETKCVSRRFLTYFVSAVRKRNASILCVDTELSKSWLMFRTLKINLKCA